MPDVTLTREQARYLSVLAAQDIRRDEERGLPGVAARHRPAWEALQPACGWESAGPGTFLVVWFMWGLAW